MAKKELRIGMIGYGFMGRTHSNGFKRVNDFFDLKYRPVLKAVCGRSADKTKAFAEQWKKDHPAPVLHTGSVIDQIDHAVKLVGVDHVGIGSDFDGVSGELPVELKSVADFPNLVAGLQARGYKDEDIRKILGGNMLRVWNQIEDRAEKR